MEEPSRLRVDDRGGLGRLARKLIAVSDIVIENYSPRVFPSWNMDYPQLKELRPDLIVLRAPAFGITGPWKNRVGYASTIEAAAGASHATGYPDLGPEGGAGGALDPGAGTHAAFALLLALEHRRRTGEGALIEVPQFTSGINMMAEQTVAYSAYGVLLTRMGNRSWTVAPQGAYRAPDRDRSAVGLPGDDWVALSVDTDQQWQALCALIGDPALSSDAALSSVEGRWTARDRIDAAIARWTAERSAEEAVDLLLSVGVPAARPLWPHELTGIAEAKKRGSYEVVPTAAMGPVPIVTCPAHFESGPRRYHRSPSPTLGQHNQEILTGLLGVDPAEVEDLETRGVIGTQARTMAAW